MVTRQRSPNYPGINLEAAIASVDVLYGRFGRGQFTANDAAEAWGYRGPSGPVRVRLAALRQYGLLDGQRGENPKLSRRALTFALRNPASREYKDALQEAALSPTLFREIRDTKPDASDGVLREYLVGDRNFTDDGAGRSIAVFRTTMELAGLDDGDASKLEDDGDWYDIEDEVHSGVMNEPGKPPSTVTPQMSLGLEHTRVPLRLMGGSLVAAVELPSQMTEAAWKQMMAMLEALKPGYVVTEDQEGPDNEADPSGT